LTIYELTFDANKFQPDFFRLKPDGKGSIKSRVLGRGALYVGRSHTERSGGQHTRENVGMSSERWVRIPPVENLRFPEEGSSAQGKSGPKPRTKVVGDGQQVENPVPPKIV